MSRPQFLMVDEPFLGLAPIVVQTILNIIKRINAAGVTVLFIEQNVQLALGASHRGYLLESGHLVAGRRRPRSCWSRRWCGRCIWASEDEGRGSDRAPGDRAGVQRLRPAGAARLPRLPR
ncbi:MAG: hypothetical protein MZV64_17020 [Ignavibacteriales bacterium]|nr:hypothetical protein [Ignavibacteriales bacterium]